MYDNEDFFPFLKKAKHKRSGTLTMYYRRKILLSLLRHFGGAVDKRRLQHLLLLFSMRQAVPVYDFIPYHDGACSFTAIADLSSMERKGFVREDGAAYFIIDETDSALEVKEDDERLLRAISEEYGSLDERALVERTYGAFPEFAARCYLAEHPVPERKPAGKNILFTIGYQGLTLERYLNRLLEHDIRTLVDIRNHPVSRKFGFSKNQLTDYCSRIGIAYIHFPEFGIPPERRQHLTSKKAYEHLLAWYEKVMIPATRPIQHSILALLKDSHRLALTCFEADLDRCHRKYISEALIRSPEFAGEVRHI